MNERLRKVFFPTDEEIAQYEKQAKELYDAIPDTVELVKDHENDILYVSNPFHTFKKDCSFCLNYEDSPFGFVEGGDCIKHNIGCGWGYTCNDWTMGR